jgi:hypothetical protein
LAIVNQPGLINNFVGKIPLFLSCHSVIGRHSGGKNKGENILQLELSKKKVDPATKKFTQNEGIFINCPKTNSDGAVELA